LDHVQYGVSVCDYVNCFLNVFYLKIYEYNIFIFFNLFLTWDIKII
jgi:hypothetical protein